MTVSHPLRQSASQAVCVGAVSAAAEAEDRKIAARKIACAVVGWDFVPFGYDTVGGLGPAARSLCRKLAKQLAMQAGADSATTALMVGQHLSLTLAKGRGEMLTAATPLLTTLLLSTS